MTGMTSFTTPQVILFTRDMEAAVAFYTAIGFTETFRTPMDGSATHVDLVLHGYRIGLSTEESVRDDHGVDPVAEGQRAAVVLWTDDTTAGYSRLRRLGAHPVKEPSPWRERLLIAWVEDPDGHLIQLVQEAGAPPEVA